MSHDHGALIAQFTETLTQQRYNPVVVHNSCRRCCGACRNGGHLTYGIRSRRDSLPRSMQRVPGMAECAARTGGPISR
jgi:hypothetical protein